MLVQVIEQITNEINARFTEEERRNASHFVKGESDRYVMKVKEIMNLCDAGDMILDIGCGFGHMPALLSYLGYDTTGINIGSMPKIWNFLEKRYGCRFLKADAIKLPFKSNSFDSITAFGSLEHIGIDLYDVKGIISSEKKRVIDIKVLSEVHRVLKLGGYFFIFSLPNRYSSTEFICKLLGRDHAKKYTAKEIKDLLVISGFDIVKMYRLGLFPIQFISVHLKSIMDKTYGAYNLLDYHLSKTPIGLISQNINIICIKK